MNIITSGIAYLTFVYHGRPAYRRRPVYAMIQGLAYVIPTDMHGMQCTEVKQVDNIISGSKFLHYQSTIITCGHVVIINKDFFFF